MDICEFSNKFMEATQNMSEMTSDNVSPMNLVYIRKVGFEVRNKEELLKSIGVNENIILDLEDTKKEESLDNVKLLKNILKEILKEKNKYEKE